ncbi:MAG: phosphoglycerate kinase [Candidatus Eisenbacteria sp.]|nr:phosphoglycerate kinase [Candidatus Eisenbacteria bacterium]
MATRALRALAVSGKRTLVRVDFNVPLREGEVADDTRIRAALPTITCLRDAGARIVLMSHLGRPQGERKPELSLAPVARRLGSLLGQPVALAPDCIGPEVAPLVERLDVGEVLLLENLRFHAAETKNAPDFAAALAAWGEVYVNDAFGTAHRAHASTEGVARLIGVKAPGLLMEKELRLLAPLLGSAERPFVTLLGGAKVSGKIDVIESLLPRVDRLIIGGAMMFTFWKAQGHAVGRSLVEEEHLETARGVLTRAAELGKEVHLPSDCLASRDPEAGAEGRVAGREDLAPDEVGVDIGPDSRRAFTEVITQGKTIFWNGPMGIFEQEAYAEGTRAMAKALVAATERGATTVVGGGDSAAALRGLGLADQITHLSTGGGASLKFLEGKTLPGLKALEA